MSSMRKAMALDGPIAPHAKTFREALEDIADAPPIFRWLRRWYWRNAILAAAIDAFRALEQRNKDGQAIKEHVAALCKIMGGRFEKNKKKDKEEDKDS